MKTENIVCANCGKPRARIRHLSRSYGEGADLLVIENVPVISCKACGESYLTASTAREIENIQKHRRELAPMRTVPVAAFTKAAVVNPMEL